MKKKAHVFRTMMENMQPLMAALPLHNSAKGVVCLYGESRKL